MSAATAEAARDTVGAAIDMRAYAAGTIPSADWVKGRARPAFADDKAQVAALAPRGQGKVAALTSDEFVLVLAGRIEIESAGGNLVLETNMAGLLPVGTAFSWHASEDALAIVYDAPAAAPGTTSAPVLIDHTAPLTPSNPPRADLLLGPTPSCRNHSDYWSADREFVCGTWDATPYHRRQIPYVQVELMYLLDGAVSFADANGRVTFAAGDVCLFVRGEGCAWISDVPVTKVYATHRPAA